MDYYTLPESLRRLRLDAIEEDKFRSSSGVKLEDDPNWKDIRLQALKRDNYTCQCCGFRLEKYMEVHHLDGIWSDNRLSRLYTLCPLCHSCFHIGLAGVQKRASLLILKDPIGQAHLNALILNTVMKYKKTAVAAVKEIKGNLPVEQDLGPAGLIMLANRIQKEKKDHKKKARKVNEKYILFPDITQYFITRYIIENL